ncbi:MAG: tail fiber domain-containing protein [Saprospiraceae bacterium]|nr:tail fiber domain-containing protein [Saprospiraceae bacterium]MBP6567303.1 tail fiber domain-containing protein [Saprospiraceae bacterium]
MKNLNLISIIFLAFACKIIAQAPQKFSYQAVIRNSSDQLVKDQDVGLRMSIVSGSENGNIVYQEIFNPNPRTNINGLLTIQIGGGIAITGSFNNINWSAGSYFVRTEADPTGGTNYILNTTSQLLSIPYALLAKNVENIPSISLNQLSDVNTQPALVGQVLKWNGTEWTAANDDTEGSNGITYTAGSGISIDDNNVISNTGDGDNNPNNEFQQLSISGTTLTLFPNGNTVILPDSGFGGDNWGTQTVSNDGGTIAGNGTPSSPMKLAGQNATNGQVLKHNGNTWVPEDDSDKQILSISGNQLTISNGNAVTLPTAGGDNWGAQSVTTNNTMSGNGTPANPLGINVNSINHTHIQDQSISAGDLGSMGAQNGQIMKYNGTSWNPAADETGASGNAGGDLTGSYPNPGIGGNKVTTAHIQNGTIKPEDFDISNLPLNTPLVLKYHPGDNGGGSNIGFSEERSYLAGNGLTRLPIMSGVNSPLRFDIISDGAQENNVLTFKNGEWKPAAPTSNFNVITGNSLTGNGSINNPLQLNSNSVSSSNIVDQSIAASDLSSMGAQSGQVLKYNGTQWQPSQDNTGSNSSWTEQGGFATYTGGGAGAFIGNNVKNSKITPELVDVLNNIGAGIVRKSELFAGSLSLSNIINQTTHTTKYSYDGITLFTGLPFGFSFNTMTNNVLTPRLTITNDNIEFRNSIEIGLDGNFPAEDGTIQFTGSDIQGRVGGQWKSLTKDGINGTGTANIIPKFTGPTTLGNSNLSSNSTSSGDKLQWSSSKDGEFVVSGTSGGTTAVQGVIAARGSTPLSGPFVSIGSTSNHQLRFITNSTERLTISTDGIVDIIGRLRVGSIPFTSSPADIRADNNGNILRSTSDLRLKKNIRNIESALEKVKKIRPVLFDWKDNPTAINQFGFIAQEINKVLPEVVNHDKVSDYFSVDYTEIIPVLTKAIQEQQTMIDDQNKKIEALIKRIEALEKN